MAEVISIIGSIASIIGLLLYLLEKKGIVSVKIPMKVVIFIVLITAILIAISLARNTTSVEIKQNENNDHNKIEVITD